MTEIQNSVTGTGVVPGTAYAPAGWARPRPQLPTDSRIIAEIDREAEKKAFTTAATTVADRFASRAEVASGVASEVLGATAKLAKDRGWTRAAQKLIANGRPATMATIEAIDQFVAQFEKLGGLMAERTTDLKDIRDRVISEILGLPEPGVPKPDAPIVLLAPDLAPADTAGLDPSLVIALVTQFGGPTSHTAIIARQLGIPCIVAVSDLEKITDGTPIVVDGTTGTVRWGVPELEAQKLVLEENARRAEIKAWAGPAALKSGQPVQLLANVQDGNGARKAAQVDVEGVGLFRTELCFLSAQTEPDAEAQGEIYRGVLEAFPGQKVVIRTLDAGSDKPVPFASQDDEENPALGVRGVRLSFGKAGLLDHQLDGIVHAIKAQSNEKSKVWVMAPMIATIDEARRFAAEARKRDLWAGIMVEVPSVAIMADQFIKEVDFLSIGTNDLTQYTMAADRLAPGLAYLTDPWQPAVLQLIAKTAWAGIDAGKPVGVCGEAAADPILACVLTGMGITSLSMASAAVPAVGVQLSKVTLTQCREAAEKVLGALTSAESKKIALDILSA